MVNSPKFGFNSEQQVNSLSVTLPTQSPFENGTSPVNGEPEDVETLQRHNMQKLKVDRETER